MCIYRHSIAFMKRSRSSIFRNPRNNPGQSVSHPAIVPAKSASQLFKDDQISTYLFHILFSAWKDVSVQFFFQLCVLKFCCFQIVHLRRFRSHLEARYPLKTTIYVVSLFPKEDVTPTRISLLAVLQIYIHSLCVSCLV